MDALDHAILDAWARVRPALAANPKRLHIRLKRARSATVTRPHLAWCIHLRASDHRIGPAAACVIPRDAIDRGAPHEVTIVRGTIQALAAPVRLARGGGEPVTIYEAADRLGLSVGQARQWMYKGALVRTGEALVRRPGGADSGFFPKLYPLRRVAMVTSAGPLDPQAPLGRAPDPVWGTLWQYHAERVPAEFEQTIERLPRRVPVNGSQSWDWRCPGCARRVRKLYLPLRPYRLFDFVDDELIAKLPTCFRSDIRHPARLACHYCLKPTGTTLVTECGWNTIITYLTAGMLYGREVPRPDDWPARRHRDRGV